MSPPFALVTNVVCRESLMLVFDLLPVADLAFIDPQRESALWVDAYPRLEEDGSALLAVV